MEANLEFEREKWRVDVELRQRELALKEREQSNRDADIELKRREQARASWFSPLVVAIFAATVAASGNAVVAILNGNQQVTLEKSKAESDRILEMIKTGDPDRAANNLDFLLTWGLIADPSTVQKLTASLKARKPGAGPSLPSAAPGFGFESTDSLTSSLQAHLQKLLEDYVAYSAQLGLSDVNKKVTIKVDKLDSPNAFYDRVHNSITIDIRMASDPGVPLREFTHHLLMPVDPPGSEKVQHAAIESGLADYFACSFLDNPKMGEIAAKSIDPTLPYIRMLANDLKFSTTIKESHQAGEIWGGAFWAIRAKLQREAADSILVAAWQKMVWTQPESTTALSFVEAILSAARAKGSAQDVEAIKDILRAREYPLPR